MLKIICCVPIYALIGSVILRAACTLFNKLCRPENQVPEPDYGKALLATLIWASLSQVFGLVISVVLAVTLVSANVTPEVTVAIVELVAQSIGVLIMAGTATFALPAPFGRSLLVSLIFYGITLCVLLVVGGLFWGFLALRN